MYIHSELTRDVVRVEADTVYTRYRTNEIYAHLYWN